MLAAAATPPAAVAHVAACGPSAIRVSVWRASGTAGTIYYRIVFRNSSMSDCTLSGFPGVSAVSPRGRQVGAPAVRDKVSHRRVLVPANTSAHAMLGIVDWHNFSRAACRPVRVSRLRIYPPGWTVSRLVRYPQTPAIACSAPYPGKTHTMVIQPVTPGL
jgi:hypothetical protein